MVQDMSADAPANPGKEVTAEPYKGIADDILAGITSWNDAAAAMGGAVENWNDYGTGFTVIESKETLIGVPLMLLEWRFNKGDNGEFVSIAAVTKNDDKIVINDGSTGIRDQLRAVTAKRADNGYDAQAAQRGLLVENGLRVSRYQYADEKTGEMKNAATFYLG